MLLNLKPYPYLIAGAFGMALTSGFFCMDAYAAEEGAVLEEIVVTGSRIKRPGAVSTSPIYSMDTTEIAFQQETELEKILRDLPFTVPSDGQNVNNGSDGAATIDLRGLGSERNLILMNGRRMTPYNHNGEVDTSSLPTTLIERVDVITGGASAVYGSDAIAGAVNLVMKNDFEGIEINTSHSETGDSDGEIESVSITLGSNLDNGAGNVAVNLSWSERKAVLLGQRDLGTLGIDTESGANYAEFKAGQGPVPPTTAGCGGPDVAQAGGSTTSMPTRVSIAGPAGVGQFLEDRTLFTGDAGWGLGGGCSVFNFNPYNFYTIPNERYNAIVIGNFEFNDNFEAYTTIEYSNVTVDTQIAPSGTFGAYFDVPLANPFIGDQALQAILDKANGAIGSTLFAGSAGDNWNDVNANGVVDTADYLKMQLRRRTLELGPRSEHWDNNHFTFLFGAKGELYKDWDYDVSFQYGESNRTTARGGYTNLTNIQNALDSVDGVTCNNGDTTCVPIDLFGGYGTITPDMAGYAIAIALQEQMYDQTILTGLVSGPVDVAQLPTAASPLSLSLGYEHREENGSFVPDECLKLAPASCQGGAGGNQLPISGGFTVEEFFLEGYLPLVEDMAFAQSLSLEFGFRTSDYNITGSNDTWKAGLNWQPIDSLMVRVMQQEATRAPNVAELFSPVVTSLGNALGDPCSVANAANIDATLRDLCISTGMLPGQVGVVQDIVSGQVNAIAGSNLLLPPDPETADTLTVGFVWTPAFDVLPGLRVSVDYYDIDIEDFIGEFTEQEILDQCYVAGIAAACDNILRINGDLTSPSSGLNLTTTNLLYLQAEGVEIGFAFGFDIGEWGDLQFTGTINKYLTQESRSSSLTPVIDCKGYYGTSCTPLSDLRWVQRTTWNFRDLAVSLQWRHLDAIKVEEAQVASTYIAFQKIDDYDYLDLYASYVLWDERIKLSVGVDNLTDEDPPVVGGESGSTNFNNGNTYPANYDTLGRVYVVGLNFQM
jgi:outer membrane receptor protein involved in Fe transport